jgi:AcrR family transcriptional regulator
MAKTDRKQQQAATTRLAIIEAAIRAFASKGYEAATMADIAGEAGYSAPTLYNYFDNKEAIIGELQRHVMTEYAAVFDAPIPATLSFAQKLEILTLRQTDFGSRRGDAIAVMMAKPPGSPGRKLHESMHQEFGGLIMRWSEWIRAAASPEELNGREPMDLAFVLWGLHHAVLIRSFMHGDSATPEDNAKLILDFFLHGLGPPGTAID